MSAQGPLGGQVGRWDQLRGPSHIFSPSSSVPAKLVPGGSVHLWAPWFSHTIISSTEVPSLPAQPSEPSVPPPPVTLL